VGLQSKIWFAEDSRQVQVFYLILRLVLADQFLQKALFLHNSFLLHIPYIF
jgi:hypothetical protein